MRARALWAAAALALAAFAVLALVQMWPILFPEVSEWAPLDPGCDLQAGPCSARFPGGGELTLTIEPRPIPPVTPLSLRVQAKGIAVDAVEVSFVGVDMNMGLNRSRLPNGPSEGVFTGSGMLPTCVRRRMQWEARVMVQSPRGLLIAPFRFWAESR